MADQNNNDLKAKRSTMEAFCAANLKACCGEIVGWMKTGLLGNGKVRELAALAAEYVGNDDDLRVAESEVKFQALQYVAATPAVPAPDAPAELLRIGQGMSNVFYNMAQRVGYTLTDEDAANLKTLQAKWDTAYSKRSRGVSQLAPAPDVGGLIPEQALPEGHVIAPHYRGYANLGIGAYVLNHSAVGADPELVISIATDEQKAGRVVGDERANPDGYVLQPDDMAVRIRFENVAGLDALEARLRHLRAEHFAAHPADAAPNQTAHPLADEHGCWGLYAETVLDAERGKAIAQAVFDACRACTDAGGIADDVRAAIDKLILSGIVAGVDADAGAAPEQAIPEGYVLMPKSPSEAVLAPDGWPRLEWARYQAMLDAAPAPPAAPEQAGSAHEVGSTEFFARLAECKEKNSLTADLQFADYCENLMHVARNPQAAPAELWSIAEKVLFSRTLDEGPEALLIRSEAELVALVDALSKGQK